LLCLTVVQLPLSTLTDEPCLGQTMAMKTERFSSDPGWDGHNNRSQTPPAVQITQDFGYSSTGSHAGGAAGEIGGLITPAGEPAYYAKVIPVGTLDDTLTASGTLNLQKYDHALLGFFNADTINEWRTPNTLSIRLLGRNDTFFFAYGDYATSLWRAGGNAFTQVGGGEYEFASGPGDVHNWSLTYNPGGNYGGGSVTATIGGETVVTNLEPGHKSDGATFNRFGLLNVMKSVDTPGLLWLDNLTINGVSENFDTNPNWDGLNNQNTYVSTNKRPRFDFGFSPTNHAGGQNGGEMGGSTFRGDSRIQFNGDRMAYYGDELDETLTLDQPLAASGKVSFQRGVSDSTTLIGFFHSTDSIRDSDSQVSATPENFVGAAIEGPSSQGFYFYPSYGVNQEGVRPSGGYGSPAPPSIYPNGESHDWSVAYDPTANNGLGEVTVALDGQTVSLHLDPGHRQIGAQFDRFGIITTHIDGNGQTVYFDDLTYTVGIVPGSCDFNFDDQCNSNDINLMYSRNGYDLVHGVATTAATEKFDLVDDNIIDNLDITEWLSQTATENGYSSTYLRGDTYGLGSTFPAKRIVNLFDYNVLAGFFDPIGSRGPHLWSGANFDGDHDVDLTDYNALVAHFNPIGYAAAVPEPTGWCLFVAGLLLLHGADIHRPYCSDDRSPRVLPSRRTAAGNFPEFRRPRLTGAWWKMPDDPLRP